MEGGAGAMMVVLNIDVEISDTFSSMFGWTIGGGPGSAVIGCVSCVLFQVDPSKTSDKASSRW